MCSIFGALGNFGYWGDATYKWARLKAQAGDRGRDGGRTQTYHSAVGETKAILGNWRATPTPELQAAPLQPYDGIVHNGTIANDDALGRRPGEIDSMVLPRVLDISSLERFRDSIMQVKGSYAIAAWTGQTVYLATNYKPLFYWRSERQPSYSFFSSMPRHFDGVIPPGQAPVEVKPYSVLDLSSLESLEIPRTWSPSVLVVCSGGLDSTAVAAKYVHEGRDVCLLHFDYGCRASDVEAERIPNIAAALGCDHRIMRVNVPVNGALIDRDMEISAGVEGAEYAHEWVPARNLWMMAWAVAYAETHGFGTVALGNNLEEAGAYPDNEEDFTRRFNGLLHQACQNGIRIALESPVGHLMKHEIVKLGLEVGAPFELTWSCYRNGDRHCGECGPCFMRKTAFERNGATDPVFVEGM